jgi:hypothetical protein
MTQPYVNPNQGTYITVIPLGLRLLNHVIFVEPIKPIKQVRRPGLPSDE